MSLLKKLENGPPPFEPGTVVAWLSAPVFVALATALCLALGPSDQGVPFALLFAAVVVTAMVSGIGAGLLALLIGGGSDWYLFARPDFAWDDVRGIYAVCACVVVAAAIVVGIGYMRLVTARSRRAIDSLTMIFDTHPDGVLLLGADGGITDANRRAVELLGKSRETLIGTKFETLFPARARPGIAGLYASPMTVARLPIARDSGGEVSLDIRIRSVATGGETRSVATLRDPASQGTGAADIVDRANSTEEMRVWADAFTHAAVGLTITDPVTRSLRFVNKAWAEMHGWDAREVAGMPTAMFFPEEEQPRLAALYAEADRTGHVTFQVRRQRRDGSTFLAAFDVVTVSDSDGNPLYRVATSRDITASRRSEELLRHTTKMEAIGGLTGGMAHDFNNLLGAIILSLDFVKSEMDDQDHLKQFVAEAKSAAESGAELIRNLLAFARRQALHPTRIDVNDQVAGMHRLLSRVLGEEIAIVLDTAPEIWPVIADRAQLEGCLLNLATNARDAMPKGGSLTITTRNETLGEAYAKQNPSVSPGDYVMIAVADTGTGMPADVVVKVFEPFFTTKEPGRGTGLGLSMVFGFATQSGGHVSVHSKPGAGTTMRLFLPRAHLLTAAPTVAAVAAPMLPVLPAKGDGETILVVEDNVVMRRVVVRQLAELNYVVHEVDNARTALEMLENGTVDLLFSDIVMPDGMDGFELAERVRARWSSVKVLLTSGFSGDQDNRRSGAVRTTARLLGKPYNLAELARAVREALDQ